MKVLFCGGPADGQWRVLSEAIRPLPHTYEVVTPPTPRDMLHGIVTPPKFKYRIWPITILGHRLFVAAPETDHNESDSVLYAVLRRDVADHLRGRT